MTPTTHMIPIDLLLEYLHACAPVVARVSDRILPQDPLSTAVMPLVAALTVLELRLRHYQRTGRWGGVPPFLTTRKGPPLDRAQRIAPHNVLMLVPRWAARSLTDDRPKEA